MALQLGKMLNRCYNIRLPILDGHYNIGIYFNTRSTFLLFRVDPDFRSGSFKQTVMINMFKNLEASKFCETFIELHNFRKNTLDISNQFEKIKDEYTHDISFLLNESITLSKIKLHDKVLYDTLGIYGFTMNSYDEEYIFIITERHNIDKRLGKKIVRTSGLQISTKNTLNILDEYHQESKVDWKSKQMIHSSPDKIIKFSEAEEEATIDDPK